MAIIFWKQSSVKQKLLTPQEVKPNASYLIDIELWLSSRKFPIACCKFSNEIMTESERRKKYVALALLNSHSYFKTFYVSTVFIDYEKCLVSEWTQLYNLDNLLKDWYIISLSLSLKFITDNYISLILKYLTYPPKLVLETGKIALMIFTS